MSLESDGSCAPKQFGDIALAMENMNLQFAVQMLRWALKVDA